jgi:hypothetical protein
VQLVRDIIIARIKLERGAYYTAIGGELRVAFKNLPSLPHHRTVCINDVRIREGVDFTVENGVVVLRVPLYPLDLITIEPIDYGEMYDKNYD